MIRKSVWEHGEYIILFTLINFSIFPKTVFNPFSLEQTCLGFLKQLIQSYPELNKQVNTCLSSLYHLIQSYLELKKQVKKYGNRFVIE